MGNISSMRKRTKQKQEYKQSIERLAAKYKSYEKKRVVIIGPTRAGKTKLFEQLLDKEFTYPYEQSRRVSLGFKVINPKDEVSKATSFRYIDCPGEYS